MESTFTNKYIAFTHKIALLALKKAVAKDNYYLQWKKHFFYSENNH